MPALYPAALLALLLSACSPLVVKHDFDPEADFAAYRSFAWLPDPPAADADDPAHSPLLGKHIRRAVNHTLAERGLQKDLDEPDLLLAYHSRLRHRRDVDVYTYGYWAPRAVDVDRYHAITIQFDLTVPPGTQGFLFDFAFFSSEWPSWVDSQYNDQFIVWVESATYTGNLTFVQDAPLTITALDAANGFAFTNNAPELAGTGYEQHAATDWFTARGSAEPGEQLGLTFFLADLGDNALASAAALDNFRWECEGCVPNEVNSCGIQPQ